MESTFKVSVEELSHCVLELPPSIDDDIAITVFLIVVLSDHLPEDQETSIDGKQEGAQLNQSVHLLQVAGIAIVGILVIGLIEGRVPSKMLIEGS